MSYRFINEILHGAKKKSRSYYKIIFDVFLLVLMNDNTSKTVLLSTGYHTLGNVFQQLTNIFVFPTIWTLIIWDF